MTDAFRDRLAAALAATYRIDEELAGGGMSRVFAATEYALGRKVVIKVLPPDLSAGVNRERFQREIQVAAQLQHPHIVPLLSAGRIPSPDVPPADATSPGFSGAATEGELLYYTMPFIEGESLRTAIARRGRLSVRETMRILHDVVEALAYAHGRGVVHRDIKPGNILTIGSHALVTDFGVAKALSAAMPVSGMTSAGMAIGTPAYMAPEQLAADPAADHRIDIYAVGLLAYELLSGESPFIGTSPQATMAAQLTRVPESLDKVRDDVPPALAAIIMRCLEKLPENRPQTANALLDELDGVATPHGGTHASPATVQLPAASGSSGAQRRALVAGALLVVVAGAALALGTWRRVGRRGATTSEAVSTAPAAVTPPTTAGPASGGAASGAPGGGANRALGDTTARAPIVLTQAESLAIADAVRKRVTARRDSQIARGERAIEDSLTVRLERALGDSLARLFAAIRSGRRIDAFGFDSKELEKLRELARNGAVPNVPSVPGSASQIPGPFTPPALGRGAPDASVAPFPRPAPGVRRVLIVPSRNPGVRRDLSSVSSLITDSLRRAIMARGGYEVPEIRALGDSRLLSRSRASAARAVGAGAVITGLFYPRPDSLLVLQLQLFDVQRNRVVGVVESKPIDVTDPLRNVGDLVSAVLAGLDGVDWRLVTTDSIAPRNPD